jgi:hypothetical protein
MLSFSITRTKICRFAEATPLIQKNTVGATDTWNTFLDEYGKVLLEYGVNFTHLNNVGCLGGAMAFIITEKR